MEEHLTEIEEADKLFGKGHYFKARINALKKELSEYDYIGVKIAQGVSTKEEYADKIAYCESLRQQIRELEKELDEVTQKNQN